MTQPNIVRLHGESVDLCVFRTDEAALEKYMTWMNDESFVQWIGRAQQVCTWTSEMEYVKNDHNMTFNIVTKDGEMIGNCDIKQKGLRNYRLGICIGEESARNNGFGTETIKLLIQFAFKQLNAHRVDLRVDWNNKRAVRCYTKAGLKITGVEHEATYYDGSWSDIVTMEMTEDEYRGQETFERCLPEPYEDFDWIIKFGINACNGKRYFEDVIDGGEGQYACDFEVWQHSKTKKYGISMETFFGFDKQEDCVAYVQETLDEFTDFMNRHNYNTTKELNLYQVFTEGININSDFDTIEDAYAAFKFFARGFNGNGIFLTSKSQEKINDSED